MKFLVLALCAHLSLAFVVPNDENNIPLEAQILTGPQLVEYLNQNQQLFKAALSPPDHHFRSKLMKLKYVDQNPRPMVTGALDWLPGRIPKSFDARTKWPECPSLFYIRDQSNCGSCWAVSSAEVMSDRLCIASKGKVKVEMSADDMLTCCRTCGYGCDGGWPIKAFQYFADVGVVTGGDYGTKDACRPYEIHPCGHHVNVTYYGECYTDAETPACVRKCQPGYNVKYKKDKRFGKTAYRLPNNVKAIQKEIMTNGPVVAGFTVYEDFAHYQNGIYKHTAGGPEGGHAVKIIGWGEEKGVPYWLIANSWNRDWGENGYFRMIRGINNCGIEQDVVTGTVREY